MSLRLIISPQPTNVVPLRPARTANKTVDEQPPELPQLGEPMVVALPFRGLSSTARCESCRKGL
jgi:hypothetical protein